MLHPLLHRCCITTTMLLVGALMAAPAAGKSPAPLFEDASLLPVVLTIPVAQLNAQKKQRERIFLPGQWSYRDDQAETVRLSVKVRTRGNFRREFCRYPPLQLNFREKEVKGTLFKHQDKLKLVMPCKAGKEYQNLVVREYLAYRIHAQLTEHTFLVRPLEIHIVDSDQSEATREVFGFLIEDEDEMAKRLGGKIVHENSVNLALVDPGAAALTELFEYLIGNGDYSVWQARPGEPCCHNMRDVDPGEGQPLIPVPYDFDASGIVNAPYADPPAHLPITSVKQRYFTGICKEPAVWQNAIARFNEKRAAIYDVLNGMEQLSATSRKETTKYLDEFYATINDKDDLQSRIIGRCRS